MIKNLLNLHNKEEKTKLIDKLISDFNKLFSDEFRSKTNSKLVPLVTLVEVDKKNLRVLNVGGKFLGGQVGHLTLPNASFPHNFKSLSAFQIGAKAGLGFNTVEGNAGFDFKVLGIRVRGGFKGAIGGLSANASFNFSTKSGFKTSFIFVPGIGGGGYFNVGW